METIQNIINKVIDIIDDLIPDSDKKNQVKLLVIQELSKLKSRLVISIMTVLVYLVFQVKTLIIDNYLYSDMFYIDLVLMALVMSFQFSIPFKDLLKAINNFLKKKKEK